MTRVLIVDDETKLVGVLVEFLQSQGFEVWSTGRGDEAVRLAEQHRPQIMLLDMNLDGNLTGLDVIERVKTFLPKTIFFVVSGYTEQSWKDQAAQKGAARYFEKPLQVVEILEAVQEAASSLP
jgi:CheY-like chemotaxis protein